MYCTYGFSVDLLRTGKYYKCGMQLHINYLHCNTKIIILDLILDFNVYDR